MPETSILARSMGPSHGNFPRREEPESDRRRFSGRRIFLEIAIGIVISAILLVPQARATSVIKVTFEEMCARAEVVFMGTVVESASYADETTGLIRTRVRFEVLDLIAGPQLADSIELEYLGGRVGETRLWIPEIEVPMVGESGIYFVSSTKGAAAHPLVGWKQGHFLVRESSQHGSFVATADGRSIVAINEEGQRDLEDILAVEKPLKISTGVAAGLKVSKGVERDAPINIEQFKHAVRVHRGMDQ